MSSFDVSFPLGWYGSELEGYRSCEYTYCWFPYDSLPQIPDKGFQGDFNWLAPLELPLSSRMERYRLSFEEQVLITENIKKLTNAANMKNVSLPETFVAFMSNLELQNHIPSCTACYFDLIDELKSCPVNNDNFVIRFLNDQQGVFTWYLYLGPDGKHCVIVSTSWFDLLATNKQDFTHEDFTQAIQQTFVCAQSFEEFLYRFWLENCIWFVLTDKHRKLTEAEENYLMHYKYNKTGD